NQPTLHADIKSYFETAPTSEVEQIETVGKDHGRIEVRTYMVSHVVDWYAAERSYPGAPRFPQLTTIATVESHIERGDKIETEQRSYISSRALSAAAFAEGARFAIVIFPVLGEPATAAEPGEGSFDDPAFWQDDEAFGLI